MTSLFRDVRVMKRYSMAQLDYIEPVSCPCRLTRRAFADEADAPASMHLVDIKEDARSPYHKGMTEMYVVLDSHWCESPV